MDHRDIRIRHTDPSVELAQLKSRMNELPLIKCPGCRTIVNPMRAACPGCGACFNCGRRRAVEIKQCDQCDLPYCECCGRCSSCLQLRYSDIVEPCECGHPIDETQLSELVRYNAVVGAETQKMPLGCLLTLVGVCAIALAGIGGVVLWLR